MNGNIWRSMRRRRCEEQWHDKRVYRNSEVQIKAFFHRCSLCAHFALPPPLHPLFPSCAPLSSLLCNDHSSALQEPVPFSTACSLILPALGSSAPVCSSRGGGPHRLSSSQMTTIFHTGEEPEASKITPVQNLSRNSLAHIITNYNILLFFISSSVETRRHHCVKCKWNYYRSAGYFADIKLYVASSYPLSASVRAQRRCCL